MMSHRADSGASHTGLAVRTPDLNQFMQFRFTLKGESNARRIP